MLTVANILSDALKATGQDAKAASQELRDYAAQALVRLAAAVGQPGYTEAVQAEADNVALKAAQELIGTADKFDARILGILVSSLDLGAKLVAVGA